MKLPFAQIDAFASRPFTGNPAGVMPLAAWLDDAVLLAIAQENNLSETAFLVPDASGTADYELRWFTPAAEVALCGHATLASGHYVLGDGTAASVSFATRQAGHLTVTRLPDGYALALPAWTPSPRPLDEVVTALGATGVVDTLYHDKGYPVVVLDSEAAVRSLAPDQPALERCGPYVVVVTAPGTQMDIVSRVFTPAYGIDEDPVTGSAHAVVVPYWSARLGRSRLSAFQASARGGTLTCEHRGDRVILEGQCVTVIEGSFTL